MLFLLQNSVGLSTDAQEQIRRFTRQDEFDYLGWMAQALIMRNGDLALNTSEMLDAAAQKKLVEDWLALSDQVNEVTRRINRIYADPEIADAARTAQADLEHRVQLVERQEQLGRHAEQVIQEQVANVLGDWGLAPAEQALPPVLFRVTPLPYALVVSPRDHIELIGDISLNPGLPLEERVRVEQMAEAEGDLSALAVGIGGVGVYPTMVMGTTDLNWLTETVAHEWVHNYLTLRPLGVRYELSPELRTMNETAASLAGKEIGGEVIRRFYPERIPVEPGTETANEADPEEDRFDFRAEMHKTRLRTDELLQEGKIEEAEAWMEARRAFFWENGYQIRRINQAYFAFFGAYNDVPGGGEAGADPVGPAVQALRARSGSLAEFLRVIGQMRSFADLQAALGTD